MTNRFNLNTDRSFLYYFLILFPIIIFANLIPLFIFIILYIISPIDIIPDFIPMAGYADDVLLPILFLVAEKLLSDGAIEEHERPIKEAKKI